MKKHAIGIFNGNWKGGHKTDELPGGDTSKAASLGYRAAELVKAGYLDQQIFRGRSMIQATEIILQAEYDYACVTAWDADTPHDPRTTEQIEFDEWETDTKATLESVRPF